jgi:hypothetical protein
MQLEHDAAYDQASASDERRAVSDDLGRPAPAAAWVVRNLSVSGVATDRAVQPARLSLEHLQALTATFSAWWLPGVDRVTFVPGQDAITAAGTCTVILFLGYGVVRWVVPTIRGRRGLVQTPVLFLLFSVIHIITVLLAIGLWRGSIPGSIPLDNRILVPAFVTFLIPSAYVLHIVVRSSVGRLPRNIGLLLALDMVLTSLASGVALAQYFHLEGRGYNSPSWRYPSIDRAISRVDPKIPVLSNQAAAVRFLMKRSAREASPQGLSQTLQASGEVIVIYFDNPRTFSPRHEANVRPPRHTRAAPDPARPGLRKPSGAGKERVALPRTAANRPAFPLMCRRLENLSNSFR